ncbi:hypothetical protein BAUCODRAFT_73920 [Baudoinia panamericana UAMH 10762]|uniref:Uncharacterized protein n=1 Tax=Baudoinia panamericana (strain UAMH 10762) TaxID=717646 RepID=M2N655_BAUPA|nr:uncharacterized protein BAUCODRAFT_73920 [Baudoinia panamericana UAMH 10762]EMC94504.1 hypothetical protein BAUCODRAFT_73920 [Baudoinia panamericana UAMH 10762]
MDVHRSRFVPYPASAISALAFSRSNDSGYAGPLPALRLAIGRANGDIELWNPLRGIWAHETTFVGDGKSIDGLAWTQDPDEDTAGDEVTPGQQRLFSIAASPDVIEWDLATGDVKRKSTGNFSEVWCFGVQPRWKPSKNLVETARAQDIIAGCADGTIVLLSTADNDLQFKRFLARVSGKRSRCMCIAYQNQDVVVAGFADGVLRVFDTRNGTQIRQMYLGTSVPGAPKTAIVWQVRTLANGDLVSCDSNGELRFWDGRNFALLQRLSGHDCDCLDITTSTDGRTVFSSSLDGKVAMFRQAGSDGARRSWGKVGQRRVHQGEAKVLASFDAKAGLSVVVSGGRDVAPVLTPMREFSKENHRTLPGLPQELRVASAPRARLLVSWWNKQIYIWRIARQAGEGNMTEPQIPRKLVAKLALDVSHRIRHVSVSANGKLLAVATSFEIKVFQLRKRLGGDALAVRKIDIPTEFGMLGARLLTFSPDNKWLAGVTPEREVHLARFAADEDEPKRVVCLPETVELERQHRRTTPSAFRDYDRTITRLAFSGDSSVIAAGDVSGCLDCWVLNGHEDVTALAVDKAKHDLQKATSEDGRMVLDDSSGDDDEDGIVIFYGQHWSTGPSTHMLPKLDTAPLILTFRPQPQKPAAIVNGNPGVHATRHDPHAHWHGLPRGQYRLWVLTARHQMYELDVLAGRLDEWSKRNPTAALPEEFWQIKDRAIGFVWDVTRERERLWLYGSSWVFMLNVGGDIADLNERSLKRKRRKPKGGDESEDATKRPRISSGAGDRTEQHQSLGTPDTIIPHRRYWLTFNYRPILGIVPLEDEADTDPEKPLEVAIVERPLGDR